MVLVIQSEIKEIPPLISNKYYNDMASVSMATHSPDIQQGN